MKVYKILLLLCLMSISSFANPYQVIDNTAKTATLNITGNVVAPPLKLFPPNPNAFPAVLGDINPGETLNFSNKIVFFGVEGAIGYNVQTTVTMELEDTGLHITPNWEVEPTGNLFGSFQPFSFSGNSFTDVRQFSATGGISYRASISSMHAEPGAPHGLRTFVFNISCIYVE